MAKFHTLTICLFVFLLLSCSKGFNTTTIAFGSCSHQFDSLQMWDNVIAHDPVAWIWLGDNIYGDTYDMDEMKAKYDMQKQRASYQRLLRKTKVFGIWDDHDYGINDGGSSYTMKDESKELLLDFLDIPENADVRRHSGAYQSYLIENQGLTIKLILLDTRYFRDSLNKNPQPPPVYLPRNDGTILGEAQWQWLEKELTNSTADIHVIGSSIQLISEEHGYEKWANFPNERKRFFDLIVKTKPKRLIILSGDRHIAEFSKIEPAGLGYPVYEFTSSGLTHTWSGERPEANKFRIGKLMVSKNFGIITINHNNNSININLTAYDDNNEKIGEVVAKF